MRDGTFRQNGSLPIGDGRSEKFVLPNTSVHGKEKKKSGNESEGGDRDKAFLGWYTASSRYRARNAKDREAIGRATANKT